MKAIDIALSKDTNVLKNVLGVADATWGSAPPNLANLTDEVDSTLVTAGTKTISATSGTIGIISFDLGASASGDYFIAHKVGLKSTTGNIFTYIESSANGSDYSAINYIKHTDIGTTTEKEVDCIPALVSKRYFRIRYYVSGATNPVTCEVRPVSLRAYKKG